MRALLLIDIQEAFDDPVWGARNNPGAEARAGQLLAHWRAQEWTVFHVRHLSTDPDSPLFPDKRHCGFHRDVTPLPGEAAYEKSVNSAFIGTGLEADMRFGGVTSLVICGLTAPHYVSTTTRMVANLGFAVALAHDACAAVAGNADTSWRSRAPCDPEAIHRAAIDHLSGEFAIHRAVSDILAA